MNVRDQGLLPCQYFVDIQTYSYSKGKVNSRNAFTIKVKSTAEIPIKNMLTQRLPDHTMQPGEHKGPPGSLWQNSGIV